ncbi:MAG: tetratricopeptide repeat protein [Deltaproteobacteria bacterium]|jgi:tetratricopeptide (TPR) repeat protein|nr:tetratricopeptide repeat protein [Deltaproteobacteria bacterium]
MDEYAEALPLAGSGLMARDELSVKARVLEGETLFGAGDLAGADRLFKELIEECPGNVQALNNLAVVALARGERDAARGYLREAVAINPEFLEARYNLAEIYALEEKYAKASAELKAILRFKPDDIPTVKRLAQIYLKMGDGQKAQELLGGSGNLRALKGFIDSLWLGVKFYAAADGLSARERLEKLMLAVLKLIDGQDGRSQVFRLVGEDPETGEKVVLEKLAESFYYQESREFAEAARAAGDEEAGELILTVGEHEDWRLFHRKLRDEMRAEGGCLGDFTQTKKVLRRNPEFQKYNLELTLRYFLNNVGPCDCHVLRAVLV